MAKARGGTSAKACADALRAKALAYPETVEDFPWGHSAFKVKGKTFLFMNFDQKEAGLSLSVKLPQSRGAALGLGFCEPTGYGLGKSGWVTATFNKVTDVPMDLLKSWIDESYRAIAPKKLIKTLG